MSHVSVVCPTCGCAREMERSLIPQRRVNATCPRCGSRFPFTAHLEETPLPPPPLENDDEFIDPFPGEVTGSPFTAPNTSHSDEFIPRRLVFTGQAREYFGIWIVNLLLKIVTFGLFSAWAKVRKRRYFYGNTLLGDVPFDYTADPLALFKGWLIGAGIFVVYSLGSQVNPVLGGLFGLLFFLGMPWLIVRSHMFNHRNTVHRNIRFSFAPNYREAYLVYAGLPLLALPTLGLIMPYVLYRQKKFLVENSSYGNLQFSFLASAGDYYRFFVKVYLGVILLLVLFGVAAAGLGFDSGGVLIPLFVAGLFAFYFFVVIYVQTGLDNLAWNATFLGDAWFTSTLRARDMAWLYLSNAVAIACTFGLMIPWAAVRTTQYRCERLEVSAPADLRSLAVAQAEVSAGGEEIGDIFGVDVGL